MRRASLQQIAVLFALSLPSLAVNVDSALLEAARQADAAGVLRALDQGANASITDSRGFTPLMWAAAFGNTKILDALLESGADVNPARYDGMTALALGAAHGYREIVSALLRRYPLTDLETELRAARENKRLEIARQLTEARKLGESLLQAATDGNLPAIETLIAAGAPVNYQDREQETALIRAAAGGSVSGVVFLLRHGAVNLYDPTRKHGRALLAAESHDRKEVFEALLPLEPDRLDRRLWEAAAAGETGQVISILRLGGRIDSSDSSGYTALLWAVRKGHVDTVKALLARGADVQAKTRDGLRALDLARQSESPGLIAILQRKSEPGGPVRPLAVAAALKVIGEAISRYSQLPGLDQQSWKRAAAAHADLQARAAKWRQTSKTPVEYGLSLTRDAMMLVSGLKNGDARMAKTILTTVAEDLETKIEDCERKGATLSTAIKLQVRTIRAGREVNNLQVLYLPKIMEVALDVQPDVFPGFSSPTADRLAPGRYLVWARDPQTGKSSGRMPVRVGGGMSEIVLDLPVQ
jgi:ankyrin repeat protein